jgi:hypothetical protein
MVAPLLALVLAHGAAKPGAAVGAEPVRQRDWMNAEYDLGNGRFVFVAGRYADLTEGRCAVCLYISEVTFGDVDGDGQEEAILLINSDLGGAATSLGAYVFGLVDGKPVLGAHIEGATEET